MAADLVVWPLAPAVSDRAAVPRQRIRVTLARHRVAPLRRRRLGQSLAGGGLVLDEDFQRSELQGQLDLSIPKVDCDNIFIS